MNIDVIATTGGLASLRREWGELLDRSAAAVFCSWEWLYPWHGRVGAKRVPRVLVARDAHGRLEGVLPLCEQRLRGWGGRIRRWSFLGETEVGSDGLDVVAERGRERELAVAFAQWLSVHSTQWDVLELADLPATSATVNALGERFKPSHEVRVAERFLCPWTQLVPGEPFDAFLKRTGRRENFLRRLKWLKEQPDFRMEVATTPSEVALAMSELFRLHALRWATDGGSSGIKGSAVEGFHRDAAELLAERGKLRLHTMWLGELAVAAVYGMVHRGEFIYFQAGFDPAFKSRSVGMVLVGETFRQAIAEGLGGYDFLRGTEAYKADWVSDVRRTSAVSAVARTPAGMSWLSQRAAARAIRKAAKVVLPVLAAESIRRWRRGRAGRR